MSGGPGDLHQCLLQHQGLVETAGDELLIAAQQQIHRANQFGAGIILRLRQRAVQRHLLSGGIAQLFTGTRSIAADRAVTDDTVRTNGVAAADGKDGRQ